MTKAMKVTQASKFCQTATQTSFDILYFRFRKSRSLMEIEIDFSVFFFMMLWKFNQSQAQGMLIDGACALR